MFWFHQNQQGLNNLPLFDDDETPYQKIKGKIQFKFKTPPKHMHNENLKIGQSFFLNLRKPLEKLSIIINEHIQSKHQYRKNIQSKHQYPQHKIIIKSIRTHFLHFCHYQKGEDC